MPYANEYYNKPEMTGHYGINFLPEIDLAKGMETELADYSVFEKVFYTDRNFPKDADYLIRVRIKKNQIYIKRNTGSSQIRNCYSRFKNKIPSSNSNIYCFRFSIKTNNCLSHLQSLSL